MEKTWQKEIALDMIQESYQMLAETIGIEPLLNLAKTYGGTMLYIPKYESLTRNIRDKKIKKDFTGGNIRELAIKYNLCESSIRNIVNNHELDGQTSLFD